MKNLMILTSFLALAGCKTEAQKLKISTVYAKPERVEREVPETGSVHTFTTLKEVTVRLEPGIFMLAKNKETLKFRIQGNIYSAGHTIHRVTKIRFEKGEQNGNSITLKYYVKIKKNSGKESAEVRGYNYTKDETYRIPDDVKLIKIELYEDRTNDPSDAHPKLIAQKTFNFFATI
ncbi:MAG: hypothetical protein LBE92_11600 [Chryseobacterium sp.]|uniref:hypothetical protein n=1 Tax=Chryseobacterium sp. TaxID=1871047 RepID=UPI0028324A74|nr:hypothetical protein [Chryseobacterium sp.]MDR2236758.1 hypothetical protein [Chryseobacterium sp.]